MYMFQPEQTQALRDPRVDDRSGSPTPMNVTSNSKWVGEPDYIQMTGLPADGEVVLKPEIAKRRSNRNILAKL